MCRIIKSFSMDNHLPKQKPFIGERQKPKMVLNKDVFFPVGWNQSTYCLRKCTIEAWQMSLFIINVGFWNMVSRYFSVLSILYDPAVSRMICSLIFFKHRISLNDLCCVVLVKSISCYLVHEAELLFCLFSSRVFQAECWVQVLVLPLTQSPLAWTGISKYGGFSLAELLPRGKRKAFCSPAGIVE